MKKKAEFKKGDEVRVLSGIPSLTTTIERFEWNNRYQEYIYWFKDEDGKEWHEFAIAIEKI